MTTPPKASRFHIDRIGATTDSTAAHPSAGDAETGAPSGADQPSPGAVDPAAGDATSPFSQPGIRLTVRRRTDHDPDQPAPDEGTAQDGNRPEAEALMQTGPADDGFGDRRFPTAGNQADGQPDDQAGDTARPAGSEPPEELERKLAAIRAENLTERQLRIARRIAGLHQIEVASDHEAVLRLRERGIDPSHRTAVSRILSAEGARAQVTPAANVPSVVPQQAPLPATMPAEAPAKPLPSREDMTEERRAAEIYRIQRDIARRRRRRLAMVFLRLSFFVFLPTLIAAWYYFSVATPLYATKSQFQIQQASSASGGELGGLFSGTQLATNPDSVAVQSYLTSRDAMLRLDQDLGFKRAFQDPAIDPIQRLAPEATNEAAYKVYENSVKIGYDPTEGMINMEVIAPDPQLSQDFSLALIKYAEGQVDQMTSRLRDDQMKGALSSYADAEEKVLQAQRRVQELQQHLGVLDPIAEGSVVMQQISQLEMQLNEKQLELGQLLANARPQQSRVESLRGEIARLQKLIGDTRLQLTQGNETRASLASISGELRIAEGDLATRQELLATSAAQLETARIEANKQVRYLSMSVAPIPPDEASYPKAFQNTLVAFLIFSGIYLMLSLTASILREQVST